MSETLVIEVVRKTVTVDCAVEEAFRVFTTDAHELVAGRRATRSTGRVSEIVFEEHVGGEVYEVVERGRERALGDRARLGSAEPARPRLEHPRAGRSPPRSRCDSCADGDGTRVELEHRGWEALADGRERETGLVRHRLGPRPRPVRSPWRVPPERPSVTRRGRAAPGTSGGARSTEPPRSRATSTGGRRAPSRRASLLETVLASPAEDARVGGLPDERDHVRAVRARDLREPLGAPDEVPLPEIARASRRPSRRVRQADPEAEELVLLLRLQQTRCESGRMEQTPEVVARIREVRPCGSARPTGVDPAEDDPHTRPEDVRDGGLVCSGGFGLARVEAELEQHPRSRSPSRTARAWVGLRGRAPSPSPRVAPAVAALVALGLAERPSRSIRCAD